MFEIYGANWCSFCVKAKNLLEEKGIDFVYRDIDNTEEKERLKAVFDRYPDIKKTIPQIFIGEQRIGGFDDLREYLGN